MKPHLWFVHLLTPLLNKYAYCLHQAEPELLFHARTELGLQLKNLEACDSPNEALINDISTVFDFIREYFGDSIGSLNSLSEHGEITYTLVWALFPPNSLVFTVGNKLQELQVFIFREGKYSVDRQTGEKYYLITSRIINHNGMGFGYSDIKIKIPEFEGSRKVRSLAAFPFFRTYPGGDGSGANDRAWCQICPVCYIRLPRTYRHGCKGGTNAKRHGRNAL
jgi:hypothetical protein